MQSGECAELAVRVPAKVNLVLEVLGRRPDGYHEIRTVMQAVSLFDDMRLRRAPGPDVTLSCDHARVPTDERNLVVRAARLLQERCGSRYGASVALQKGIPVGGGLGGGSADGGVALLALCRLWGLDVPAAELAALAAMVGSDVPFFLTGGAALCRGRGDVVMPVSCGRTFHHVLVMPDLHVSTGQVYAACRAALTECAEGRENVLRALSDGDPVLLGRSLRNDLEEAAFAAHRELRELRRELSDVAVTLGATGVLLAGSGSGFFVVARGERQAADLAEELRRRVACPCVAVHSLGAWSGSIDALTSGR